MNTGKTHNAGLFTLEHTGVLAKSARTAVRMAEEHFNIPSLPSRSYPFQIATLGELDPEEISGDRFARLVLYERPGARASERRYRICLQDNIILRRIEEEKPSILLHDLLLYVLLHEIIHVIRFQREELDFEAPEHERMSEERIVHQLTHDILADFDSSGMRILLERYSPYRPGRNLITDSKRLLIL